MEKLKKILSVEKILIPAGSKDAIKEQAQGITIDLLNQTQLSTDNRHRLTLGNKGSVQFLHEDNI